MALRMGVGRPLDVTEGYNGVPKHQPTDPAEEDDVQEADDEVDLPGRLEHPEQERAERRPEEPSYGHHCRHSKVGSAAPEVDRNSGHARPGDLGRGGGDGDRRGDSVENQEWRRQEPAADAEHARQDADQRAKRDDQERVDRLARDGEVDVHLPDERLAAKAAVSKPPSQPLARRGGEEREGKLEIGRECYCGA